ncbi:MAG TPA: hypothetical protein VFB52_07845 [Solirubrobacterales bacterium]|nr:hypothetical protein [Solirubrobacterales bacterium]
MSAKLRESTAVRLLASPGLQHDQAQAALAASFSVTAISSPGELLDRASLPLFGAGEAEVHEQAHALADQLTNGLCLNPDRQHHRALLIDHALTHRSAHPWQIAVIGHELARRAGIASFVGLCEGEPWTVVRGEGQMALVGPCSISGRPDASQVRPRCAHQVARAVLTEIRAAAPTESADRAARLLRALPCGGRGCRRRRGGEAD